MKEFDIVNWNRKAQFDFFKEYEDPFFNITSNLDATNLYNYCKKNKHSFSMVCIFVLLKCANEIPAFRLRMKDDKVVIFDKIHIGSTVLNSDNSFSFCYFKFEERLVEFLSNAKEVIANNQKEKVFKPEENSIDLMHCSTIPWISFTGMKHARKGTEHLHGIPKIVFGKLFNQNKTKQLPFSVEVHHALMDGLHVAALTEKMQERINSLS